MNLRKYEALYIVNPKVQDLDIEKLIERFNKVVTDGGGEIQESKVWDRRTLAYEIGGHREGVYCLMFFAAPSDVPKELTRQFGITESILRSRIYVREEPKPEPEKRKKEKVEAS